MGYKKPGVRTGDGPAQGSYQRSKTGGKGKLRLSKVKCPVKKR